MFTASGFIDFDWRLCNCTGIQRTRKPLKFFCLGFSRHCEKVLKAVFWESSRSHERSSRLSEAAGGADSSEKWENFVNLGKNGPQTKTSVINEGDQLVGSRRTNCRVNSFQSLMLAYSSIRDREDFPNQRQQPVTLDQ